MVCDYNLDIYILGDSLCNWGDINILAKIIVL